MCVTEIFIDSYPDGAEVEFHRMKLCQYGYPEDPCEMHSMIERPIRYIQYGEPSSEFIISQIRTPPHSSGSPQSPASIFEFIDERNSLIQIRQKKRPLTSLFMGALFPNTNRRRRERSRSRSRSRERVVVINAPPSPHQLRTPPPPTMSSTYHESGPFMSSISPRNDDRDSPLIVEASPTRDRQRPIIHDSSRRPRSTSVGLRNSAPRRERPNSPPPPSYDERRRQQRLQEDRERRRLRDQREATLVAEIEEERERRRREELNMLHDAEINARPVRTVTNQIPLPPRPRSILRPIVEQSHRRGGVINDMGLSSRGERVIAEAIAEREQAEERERLLRVGLQAEEEEAQRERLRRRFTVSGGGGSSAGRRSRVVYDDGTYRWSY